MRIPKSSVQLQDQVYITPNQNPDLYPSLTPHSLGFQPHSSISSYEWIFLFHSFRWSEGKPRILNFNYEWAKRNVLFCAFKDLHFMYTWTHGRQCVCPTVSIQCESWWHESHNEPRNSSPKSVEPLPASSSLGLAHFLPLNASYSTGLIHSTPTWRKEMTELERMAWILRFLCFNLPKNLCVVKTNAEIMHVEPSLGTYLHLSPHLGEEGHCRMLYCLSL